jgi:hypothetical protein
MTPIMKCGHSADAVNDHDKMYLCSRCDGDEAEEVLRPQPNLEGRLARCGCGRLERSLLAYRDYTFQYTGQKYDKYVCGRCEDGQSSN